MRMKTLGGIGLVLLIALATGIGTFAAVRAIRDDPDSSTAETVGVPYPPREVFEAEARKPDFRGEVNGIFVATIDDSRNWSALPPDLLLPEELCQGKPEEVVPWEKAGELALDVKLPPHYEYDAENINSGLLACGDTITVARWTYKVTSYNGFPAEVTIARSFYRLMFTDASVDRVKSTVIGGREAVLIEPVTPNGLGSSVQVAFPEDFGMTWIGSAGFPLSDMLMIAKLVAEATK